MKVLYVLVSSEKDIFWEQTFVSITSLRRTNTNVSVAILMDNNTYDSLIGVRSVLKDMVDEIKVVNLPIEYSNKEKSRVLKTNMRNYIDGDFLFIDSDTIILSDLSDIDNIACDISAVYERNRSIAEDLGRASYQEALVRFGCTLTESDEYFNSGVMYVKDNDVTRGFFVEWYNQWLKGKSMGVMFDQPSLGVVNQKYNNYIKPLDGRWNCQGRFCLNYIYTAKIFHYLFDSSFSFPLMSKDLFLELKQTGELSKQLNDIINNPFYYIASKNEILTGSDVKRFHSRMYSFIRLLDEKFPFIYSSVEFLLNHIYGCILKCKKRNLAPPR